jgi:hypothetical protein
MLTIREHNLPDAIPLAPEPSPLELKAVLGHTQGATTVPKRTFELSPENKIKLISIKRHPQFAYTWLFTVSLTHSIEYPYHRQQAKLKIIEAVWIES